MTKYFSCETRCRKTRNSLTEKISFNRLTYFLIWCEKSYYELFSRNIFQRRANFFGDSTQCGKTRNSLSQKNSWNQLFSNFFSETVTFTKFLPKKRESKFLKFSQCYKITVWKNEKFTSTQFFPSNQFIAKFFRKTLIWRNFCDKTVAVKCHNFHIVTNSLLLWNISWNCSACKKLISRYLDKKSWNQNRRFSLFMWFFFQTADFLNPLI